MANQPSSENFGLKIIKMHHFTSKPVMYMVYRLGTTGKPLQQDLLTYLGGLPTTSTANYVTDTSKQRRFNREQIQKITSNPNGDEFDITLLFLCIKLSCEDVKDFNDPAWFSIGPELENCVYRIKKMRNEAMHENLEITKTDFDDKTNELRQLLVDTLTAAQSRYNHHFTARERDVKIQWVHDELDRITYEMIGENDLLTFGSPRLLLELENDCRMELNNKLSSLSNINPVSFIIGSNLTMDITQVYTDLQIEGVDRQSALVITYQDFVVEVERLSGPGHSGSRVVLLEGLAGAGKTTFMTLVAKQWAAGGQGSIRDLDTYQMALYVQCRDPSTSDYQQLLQRFLPNISIKYRNLLEPLVAKCRILLLIDGLDEANLSSKNLVKDLLHQLRNTNATIVCASRPECSRDLSSMTNQNVLYTRIEGIPQNKRVELVEKIHQEMKQQTISGRDTGDLVRLMKELSKNEYYRLPVNLVMATWLWDQEPDSLDHTTTQTELCYHTHRLAVTKLHQRLRYHPDTCMMEDWLREKKVDEWLLKLYEELFVALSCNQMVLPHHAADRLRSGSLQLELPASELLGSCLSLKSMIPGAPQYSVPHKGLQEYYAALYVVRTLQSQTSARSILDVMKDTLGVGDIDLSPYQNLLQQVAGLLHFFLNPVPDTASMEVVQLLKRAGVKHQNHWLDILENCKMSSNVLHVIATNFPRVSPIQVIDGRVRSVSLLLPYLSPRQIHINIHCDAASLDPLLQVMTSTTTHTCTELELFHHFNIPNSTSPASDQILQQLLSRCYLKTFVGQVSHSMVTYFSHAESLWLAIASDSQAQLLPHLHSLAHLNDLVVLVTPAVSPGSLTTLPSLTHGVFPTSHQQQSFLTIYLADVDVGSEDWACLAAAALQPASRKYDDIWFPGSSLGYEGWRSVVEGMGARDVKVEGALFIPESAISDDIQQDLDILARDKLGCSGGVRRSRA